MDKNKRRAYLIVSNPLLFRAAVENTTADKAHDDISRVLTYDVIDKHFFVYARNYRPNIFHEPLSCDEINRLDANLANCGVEYLRMDFL